MHCVRWQFVAPNAPAGKSSAQLSAACYRSPCEFVAQAVRGAQVAPVQPCKSSCARAGRVAATLVRSVLSAARMRRTRARLNVSRRCATQLCALRWVWLGIHVAFCSALKTWYLFSEYFRTPTVQAHVALRIQVRSSVGRICLGSVRLALELHPGSGARPLCTPQIPPAYSRVGWRGFAVVLPGALNSQPAVGPARSLSRVAPRPTAASALRWRPSRLHREATISKQVGKRATRSTAPSLRACFSPISHACPPG